MKKSFYCYLRLLCSSFLLSLTTTGVAASPYADEFSEHNHWIFTAYAYCLIFGALFMLILYICALKRKSRANALIAKVSYWLNEHPQISIIIMGMLWAVPIGIISQITWDVLSFQSIFPFIMMAIAFPLLLADSRFRKSVLLLPSMLKLSIFICLSAIMASLSFIILTKCGVLNGTDSLYFKRDSCMSFHILTHPYDSLKHIWAMAPFYFAETVIAVALYYLGNLIRYIWKRIAKNLQSQ